jgi:hypothetical protein
VACEAANRAEKSSTVALAVRYFDIVYSIIRNYLSKAWARSQFVNNIGHWASVGLSIPSPAPCAPFSKTCISAGMPALRSARK